MRIEKVIGINDYTLAVYYLSNRCYRFCIINDEGFVFDFVDIFYTKEAAERQGRAAIKSVSGHW